MSTNHRHFKVKTNLIKFKSDGKKEIIIPTFTKYLNVLYGETGFQSQGKLFKLKEKGFPFTHPDFSSQSSTLMYDIDKDGQMEIVIFTKNGEIVFLKTNGDVLYDKTIKIPPLEVRKHWYSGLDDEKVDISMNLKKSKIEIGRKILNQGTSRKLLSEFEIGTSNGWLSEEAVQSMDV
jgi:hypothetical protein